MILHLFVLTEKNNTVKSEAPIKCNNLRFKVKSSAVPVGMCYYSLNCSVYPIKTCSCGPHLIHLPLKTNMRKLHQIYDSKTFQTSNATERVF